MEKPGWCYFALSCVSALYIGEVATYQMCGLHASPVAPTASPVTVSSVVQEVLFTGPPGLVPSLLPVLLASYPKKPCPHPCHDAPAVSSCSFMVSGRVFKSLLRFEMISHIV